MRISTTTNLKCNCFFNRFHICIVKLSKRQLRMCFLIKNHNTNFYFGPCFFDLIVQNSQHCYSLFFKFSACGFIKYKHHIGNQLLFSRR